MFAVVTNIKPGEAGHKEGKPIDLDYDYDGTQAGARSEVKQEVAVKTEPGLSVSQIADEIAEAEVRWILGYLLISDTHHFIAIQRTLRELTERQRAAEAQQNILQASENDGIDSKVNTLEETSKRLGGEGGIDNRENILQQASKRLVDAEELDNKENVLQQANKRLKIAETLGDGFVIPKLEPE
jgi:hypothetical protein